MSPSVGEPGDPIITAVRQLLRVDERNGNGSGARKAFRITPTLTTLPNEAQIAERLIHFRDGTFL
jgi:hypothetical protein